MKKLLVVGTVLVAAVLFSGYGTTKWKTFDCPDGRFSVMLPGTPKQHVQTMNIPNAGPITITTHVTEPWFGLIGRAYAVAYADLPPVQDFNDELGFKMGRAAALEKSRGRLVSEREVTTAGQAGREMLIDSPEGMITLRVFRVGSRIYLATIVHPSSSDLSHHKDALFGSFRLVGGAQQAAALP